MTDPEPPPLDPPNSPPAPIPAAPATAESHATGPLDRSAEPSLTTASVRENAGSDMPGVSATPSSDAPVPPILDAFPVVPARPGRGLVIGTAATGLVCVLLSILATNAQFSAATASYRIGSVIGGTVFLPGVVLALLSIWRGLRTPRARCITLLVVWLFSILGHLSSLSHAPQARGKGSSGGLEPAGNQPAGGFAYRLGDLRGGMTGQPDQTALPPGAAAPLVPPAPAVGDLERARQYDFGPGSAERLVAVVGAARESRYAAISAAYASACAVDPANVDLAVERLRFHAHFADLEEDGIPGAPANLKAAEAHAERYFAGAPPVVLFNLERTYGPAFITKAAAQEVQVATWPAEPASKYWLLRAENAADNDRRDRSKAAQTSFALKATPEAGILLAESLAESKENERANQVLRHECFGPANDWIRKRRMNLLFNLKDTKAALEAYEALKRTAPATVHDYETATRVAAAGKVAEARLLVASLKPSRWNATQLARQRFSFEMEYGNKAQAVAAYRALRALGLSSDPLLRDRLSLFLKFPGTGVFATDLVGMLMLLLFFALAAAAPVLVILPVHYWSLRRQRRGVSTGWTLSVGGLGPAWLVLGGWIVAQLLAVWYFEPALIRYWFAGSKGTSPAIPVMPVVIAAWTAEVALCLVLFARARGWAWFGPGVWRWGRVIGTGLLAALAMRLAAGVYVLIVPGVQLTTTQAVPAQLEAMKAIYHAGGPLALIVVLGVFVPVLEETMLRGVVLGALARHVPWVAANAIQSVIFATLHDDLRLLPFYFAFGYVAAELVKRSRSLAPGIVMHCANNTLVCLAILGAHATKGTLA